MADGTCDANNKMATVLQTIPPSLQNYIRTIVEREKYMEYDFTITEFKTHGDNFLGKLYEIDINGKTADCKKFEHIFIKQCVNLDSFNLLPVKSLYVKEVFVYKELSKIFTSLQDQANIPQEERYKMAKVYAETDNNTIILENLSRKGFRIYKKKEMMPIKYAELGIKEMAKFHALSFVIESKMPQYYSKKIKVLKNSFNLNEEWQGLMRNICAHVASLFEGEKKQKFESFVPILFEKFPKYCNDQTSVKCTLSHGDYKKNNVLVREKDGEAVEVVPVDYQFIDYGCPVRDFMFFTFSGTDREFRRNHLNNLKELYFETLSQFLKYFNMDVETVYPKKAFEKVYNEWLDYGLIITLFTSIVVFAPETGLDLANISLAALPYCPDKYFNNLLIDLVDDFIQWGYL